jgi:putative redox protein
MVEGKRIEKLAVEIKSGAHTWLADVPAKLGGADRGPGPHELLESALTACTIITVQMYANRKGWPLTSTNVKVTVDKEGAESHIAREISFVGELSDEQKARLLEIADKCPIHKLLTSHISITTTPAIQG